MNQHISSRLPINKPALLYSGRRLALTGLLAISLHAATQAAPPPKEVGLGARAPAFALKDQNDRDFSLEAMLSKGPVALVFVRSVDWCVYCQLQAIQLSQNLTEIQAGGGQVVIISYDRPDKVKRFAQRRKLKIPILSDADSRVIDAYAMRSLQGAADQLGSAQHGTFVIDQSGIVRSKPYLTSFEGRAAVDALISALKDANHLKPEPK